MTGVRSSRQTERGTFFQKLILKAKKKGQGHSVYGHVLYVRDQI